MDSQALHKLSYGIYILTTKTEGKPYGCVINTAFQITSQPPRMAVSCNRDNFTHDMIEKSGVFGITVLSEAADSTLIGTFGYKSGKDVDKFSGLSYKDGPHTGVPLLPKAGMTTFECRVVKSMDVGTHTVFIGEICDAVVTEPESREMTYRYYHEVLKASAPKNAPTYIAPKENGETKGEQWKCSVCGYLYDDMGGTAFEDLPEDWVCPICGVGKDMFNKEE